MSKIAKKAIIPSDARIKTYYDTQPVVQNESIINFFPANPSRKVTRNNYVNNPFPGDLKRRILGLSFEVTAQSIEDDPANNIDALAIVNGLKDAGIILEADNDNKEFLRAPISGYSNFAGTGIDLAAGTANTTDAPVEHRRLVILKSAGEYRLPDPFDLAVNQTLTLALHLFNSAVFPAAADWDASDQSDLLLRASVTVAELDG